MGETPGSWLEIGLTYIDPVIVHVPSPCRQKSNDVTASTSCSAKKRAPAIFILNFQV